MGSIAAIYRLDGQHVEQPVIEGITTRLAHRLPAETNQWLEGPVALEITPHLGPSLLQDIEHIRLTADARIDNRRELAHALGWGDYPLHDISTRDLIVGAYLRWEEACPTYLIGDFAFALWDARRQCLFCARDHMGLKPFYYTQTNDFFACASEITPLLSLPGVTAEINEHRVADYLMQMYEDVENTFYTSIQRLAPAHTLTITPEKQSARRYWRLDPSTTEHLPSDEAYAERFRALFEDAVQSRIGTLKTTGSMLSGGFDSSAITCVARTLLPTHGTSALDTFSLVFSTIPHSDEQPYINAVLAQGGYRANFIQGDQLNPLRDLETMLTYTEEPFFTPNLFLYGALYAQAQERGIQVLLDGFAGDNVVSHGTRYLTELATRGRWLKLLREMHRITSLRGMSRKRGYAYLFSDFVWNPVLKDTFRKARHAWKKPTLPPEHTPRFIRSDFLQDINWMERARLYGEDVSVASWTNRKEHATDLMSGALPGTYEILNKVGAAFGLTPHLPFTDLRLLTYCLSVPAHQKYKAGQTRAYARKGVASYLPDAVNQRQDKRYLERSLHKGLYETDRSELQAFVFERLAIAKPYIDLEALQTAHRGLFDKDVMSLARRERTPILSIWAAIRLAYWLEMEACRHERMTTHASNRH